MKKLFLLWFYVALAKAQLPCTPVPNTGLPTCPPPPAPSSWVLLSSTANPSTLGQAVTLTATIGSGNSSAAPTGSVKFFNGSVLLGSVSLVSETAVLTTSGLGGGVHNIIAQYSGDGVYPPSTDTLTQTVQASVKLTVTASPATPVYGQSMTLTATVTATAPPGFSAPTGQVTFSLPSTGLFAPSTPLGGAALASGVASVSLSNLAVGTETISARYGGDGTWSSANQSIAVTVSQASTGATVALAVISGQLVLTGAVAPVAPGSGMPSGSVQFVDISTNAPVASATLSGGKASAILAASAASTVLARPIAALYSGDGNFKASTSAPLPVAVNSATNYSASFAPDEIASLFGVTGLKGDSPPAVPLTTSLGGVTVSIRDSTGTSRQAELYGVFASAEQINFLVPSGTAAGQAAVTVTLPGGATLNTMIEIAAAAPGLFTANMTGQGAYAGQIIYVNAAGLQTVTNSVVQSGAGNAFQPNSVNVNAPGMQAYLVLYGTGLRHATTVTATINGVSVPVVYFGAQGQFDGLDQVNIGPLPAALAGAGQVNLVITAASQTANAVAVDIQ